MLDVMLCGAGDTREVRDDFQAVVTDVGGRAVHYLSGDVLYVNAATGSWAENSRSTVQTVDLCVFVVVEALGSLTWQTEFREVVTSGKPFLVLCLDSTYTRYLAAAHAVGDDGTVLGDVDRTLVETLTRMEHDHQVTVVSYPRAGFGEVLRRQLALTFKAGLKRLEVNNRRRFLQSLLHDPSSLSTQEVAWAVDLALDETEEKGARKNAVNALASGHHVDDEAVLALLGSAEQGVQRLAFARLADLYRQRPPDPDFLADVVALVNGVDDVGLVRRLLATLFDLSLPEALTAAMDLSLRDVGTPRRITEQLELHEEAILAAGLVGPALDLARRCENSAPTRSGWEGRLRAFIARYDST